MPFFSIIVPTYNRAAFLSKAIYSVVSQLYKDWELIIVDDGSTDNTKEIVSNYKDSRILYVYQDNAERSAARNNGILHAQGDFVLFLDSDDYFMPTFLSDLYDQINQNEEKKILYFHDVIIENKGVKKHFGVLLPNNEKNILKSLFLNNSVIGVWQAAIPRCFFEMNKFDTRFSLWEDTHLYFRLLAQYDYVQTKIQGYCVVQHSESTVAMGNRQVSLCDVDRYIDAINDLEKNYVDLFSCLISHEDFKLYRNAKLKMYLYMARVNQQYWEMYSIACRLLHNSKTFGNVLTCIKLPFHQILQG